MNHARRLWFDHATRTVLTDPAHVVNLLKHPSRHGRWATLVPTDPFLAPSLGPEAGLAGTTPSGGIPPAAGAISHTYN